MFSFQIFRDIQRRWREFGLSHKSHLVITLLG